MVHFLRSTLRSAFQNFVSYPNGYGYSCNHVTAEGENEPLFPCQSPCLILSFRMSVGLSAHVVVRCR